MPAKAGIHDFFSSFRDPAKAGIFSLRSPALPPSLRALAKQSIFLASMSLVPGRFQHPAPDQQKFFTELFFKKATASFRFP
jgi:hypothetical protein